MITTFSIKNVALKLIANDCVMFFYYIAHNKPITFKKGWVNMSYQCYVFNRAHTLINSVEQYKNNGGNVADLKILIKDIEHGQLLSAAGLHHVDYLYEITDTNHKVEVQQDQNGYAPYFLGFHTTSGGQNFPGFPGALFGALNNGDASGLDALEAYGLSDELARQALESLRAGQYLLFVPKHETGERFKLSNVLSASFGDYDNTSPGNEITNGTNIDGAAYKLDTD